jgi:hypothetical protein
MAEFLVSADHHVVDQNKVIVRQAPQNSVVSSSFLNGGDVTFKIDKGLISVLSHAYIMIKLTNSTGAASVLAPIQSCVDRIEFYGTNGGNILFTLTGQELMLGNLFMSREEFEQLYSYLGFASTSYATTGDSVANGASKIYYIPLLHALPAAKLVLAGLNAEVSVRVVMQSSTYCFTSGSHPTVTDVSLILKGYNEPIKQKRARIAAYQNSLALKKPYLNWLWHRDTQPLTTSAQFTTILSTIKGVIAGLIFTLRSSTVTAANQNTYQAITNFDVQLANGSSMLGHYIRLHEDNKVEAAELFANLFIANKDAYIVAFSENLAYDYATGCNSGYQVFSGTEKLVFQTNSSITPGSFYIDVYALSHEQLEIFRGAIKSMK